MRSINEVRKKDNFSVFIKKKVTMLKKWAAVPDHNKKAPI